MNSKRVIIFGVTGQDGILLSCYLKKRGYKVIGVSRDFSKVEPQKMDILREACDQTHSLNIYCDADLTLFLKRNEAEFIYYLAGQSSVGKSFFYPKETFYSFTVPLVTILEYIRHHHCRIKLYNACSSEMYGDLTVPINELTKTSPISPYGYAKVASKELVEMYREVFSIFAVNGILFNHESQYRTEDFFIPKLISNVKKIKTGEIAKIKLGQLNLTRDWGLASEYVEAMSKMLELDEPEDFVIGSGEPISLYDIVKKVFEYEGLNYRDYLVIDNSLFRKKEIISSIADPEKAKLLLGWEAKVKGNSFIKEIIKLHEK